jgi:hypothetical protein
MNPANVPDAVNSKSSKWAWIFINLIAAHHPFGPGKLQIPKMQD